MAKRHTSQNEKQKHGQFFTTNADYILEGYEDVVNRKSVIDPFAGNGDLLNWAKKNRASEVKGYDICPLDEKTIKNDSLRFPPSYRGVFVLSNPPYLSKNKCKNDKAVFDQWNQNDFYKCHLASLVTNECQEGLFIIPSNFLSESSPKARRIVFFHYDVISAKYWSFPVFEDATTGIVVLYLRRKNNAGNSNPQNFPLEFFTSKEDSETIDVTLEKKYDYLNGKDFFDYLKKDTSIKGFIKLKKTNIGDPSPNTKIVVSLLEHGKHSFGLSLKNESEEDLYCREKSFTTFQITLPDHNLSLEQQKEIVNLFQERLYYYKNKYKGMFLSNYMGANQKILSRSFVSALFNRVFLELYSDNKDSWAAPASLEEFFL